MRACCAPSGDDRRPVTPSDAAASVTPGSVVGDQHLDLVALDGGTFLMGTDAADGYPADGEGPPHEVTLAPFAIATSPVTNAQFAAFVQASGHVTEAERFGDSFVFAGNLPDDFPPTRGVVGAEWWRQVPHADWRHPAGPQSDLDGIGDHPVVHVSWNDAMTYCDWSGSRLPTEAEWEFAARGGRVGQRFPWGDEREPAGVHRMNTYQGTFPMRDLGEDGWVGTCPVDAYPANDFGLSGMTGNVWEWCADWFDADYYRRSAPRDPTGPPTGHARVMRGGSYLCHESYCNRYRVDARSSNPPDSTAGNVGFRVVRSS